MNLQLKDVNKDNWIDVVKLTTNQDGKATILEKYVASNALSIAQAKIEEDYWQIKAIYDDDLLVGFCMYGYSQEDDINEICRLMIDYKYQGKGYGRKALKIVIETMLQDKSIDLIHISFNPKNKRAQKLYESIGFESTGRFLDDELLYVYKNKNTKE